MLQSSSQENPIEAFHGRTDWGAIWAGVFIFASIWIVFGTLAVAIFAGNANSGAVHSVLGVNLETGTAIWVIALTIVAMYVAGRKTAHLAKVTNRHDGLLHGMVMFGVSIVFAFIITAIGGSVMGGAQAGKPATPYVFTVASDMGWIGFVSLCLGWLAALLGGVSGVPVPRPQKQVTRDMKTAA